MAPIAAAWQIFSKLNAFKECPPEALEQYRQVFYSGAAMLFKVMSDNLSGDDPERDEEFLAEVADEVEAFANEIESGQVH